MQIEFQDTGGFATDALPGIGTLSPFASVGNRIQNGHGRWNARITSASLSAVPIPHPHANVIALPASAWLLLAGFGGLTLATRRST